MKGFLQNGQMYLDCLGGIHTHLGEFLTDFAALESIPWQEGFNEAGKIFQAAFFRKQPEDAVRQELQNTLLASQRQIGCDKNPYYEIFANCYIDFLYSALGDASAACDVLNSAVAPYGGDIKSLRFDSIEGMAESAGAFVVSAMRDCQQKINSGLDSQFASGSKRENGYNGWPSENADAFVSLTMWIRPDAVFGAVEEVLFPSPAALFQYELFHLLQAGVLLKRCVHCGRYFVVTGRPDTLYCQRSTSDGSTCALTGSAERFKQKCASDPALAAYQRAYKRVHARQRKKSLTAQEFGMWTSEAKLRLAACASGELPLLAFERWLGNLKEE